MSSIQNMTLVELLKAFKNHLIAFVEDVMRLLPNEADLYQLRITFAYHLPMETALKILASRILPYTDLVKSKDEKFFIECTDIFSGIQQDKVSYFKDLWMSGTLTDEDKEQLWKWFKLFLYYAIQYNKLNSNDS